ncbi:MAG TPA: PAS domain-containing protein, partial [Polyangium sp.]|nr:PAS domain-containing protein [Polyangium sp.]
MAGPKYHIGARIHVNNNTSSRETSSHLLDNVLSIHAPIMIHVLDEQGRIVEVNRCWLEKMGYPAEQVVGRRISEFVTRSFLESSERDLAAIGTRESFMGLRRELITASGTIIEVEVDVRAIKDENIQEPRLIGIAVDVTARNQREREIRAREEELRRLLDCAPDGIMIHIDEKYVYG